LRYLFVLLLAACASYIDTSRPPPADWPQLKETIVPTTRVEVMRRCPNAASYNPAGCALIYFAERQCVILDAGADLAHERMHCRGYDHYGETAVHDAWERYKARNGL
jgi:hypothetical protein